PSPPRWSRTRPTTPLRQGAPAARTPGPAVPGARRGWSSPSERSVPPSPCWRGAGAP
ncbi:MAG: hypothetical protein AVDCRST_MAG35-711, partial [uncultured Quadrisphaera sp.]